MNIEALLIINEGFAVYIMGIFNRTMVAFETFCALKALTRGGITSGCLKSPEWGVLSTKQTLRTVWGLVLVMLPVMGLSAKSRFALSA